MPIHPEIAKILATIPAPPEGPLNPAAMRAGEEVQVPPLADRTPVHRVQDTVAATAAGDVPVRIYTPEDADSYGVLVYFHGGAFFLGSLDTHDHVARALANESGYKVISVGYRLAPEAAFPAGLEDCYGVVEWVTEQAGELDWNGKDLAVAGDSSGGTFAAAVTAMAKDRGLGAISHQILFYPSLDLDFDADRYASMRENAVGYGLETAGLKPFNAFYLDSGADPSDPLVSPIKREDLSGLPKALVITAEFDPLRDEGELYAQRLRSAGVETVLSRYDGANHGFVANFSWIPEFYGALAEAGKFLRGGASQ
ncbi:alpha/beta hydrolase [Arthrobacter caoxuetaonis]|uniref:alpha/beta hydrolase n=1 Tax=Arthrobacter caoxuetaonis TaxID=2886935 RepID=UPI001D157EBF|nr:alpha/beta hydrolase [Arthrobacter caoxuetaonis]MCC3281876.1 alpha/beta hydrolase [Arthrobacter caoxuetaonis]MCC3283085.1 alpha/beta hydrolase [Arthrobacter caoxuetaonis]